MCGWPLPWPWPVRMNEPVKPRASMPTARVARSRSQPAHARCTGQRQGGRCGRRGTPRAFAARRPRASPRAKTSCWSSGGPGRSSRRRPALGLLFEGRQSLTNAAGARCADALPVALYVPLDGLNADVSSAGNTDSGAGVGQVDRLVHALISIDACSSPRKARNADKFEARSRRPALGTRRSCPDGARHRGNMGGSDRSGTCSPVGLGRGGEPRPGDRPSPQALHRGGPRFRASGNRGLVAVPSATPCPSSA